MFLSGLNILTITSTAFDKSVGAKSIITLQALVVSMDANQIPDGNLSNFLVWRRVTFPTPHFLQDTSINLAFCRVRTYFLQRYSISPTCSRGRKYAGYQVVM